MEGGKSQGPEEVHKPILVSGKREGRWKVKQAHAPTEAAHTPPAVISADALISPLAQEFQMDNRRLDNCDEKISSTWGV